MRTTVTLTAEAESLLHKAMRERGLSFKDAINSAIVDGLSTEASVSAITTPSFDLGVARMNLDRALVIASELEDEHLLHKRELGK